VLLTCLYPAVLCCTSTSHGIDVDVLVIDWKHYACVGDWGFTLNHEVCWPDPKQMIETLTDLGVKQVFVSVHPWSQEGSTTHQEMVDQGLCLHSANGSMLPWGGWTLPTCKSTPSLENNCLYDPSSRKARSFLWSTLKESYYDEGILNFWTDGTEPAGSPSGGLPLDAVFYANDSAVTRDLPGPAGWMMWPVW
jgi:alpha-glucosidase (family GH31 glycosyl hydrolase)